MMIFKGFEEAVEYGSHFREGEEAYRDAYITVRGKALKSFESGKRHTKSYQNYFFRQRRLGSLMLLRNKKLTKALFDILDACESEDKAELIFDIYDELRHEKQIRWADLLYVMSQLDDDSLQHLAGWYFDERKFSGEKEAYLLGESIAPFFHEHFVKLKYQYYRIVKAIASVVKNEDVFLQTLEHRMKKLAEQSAKGTSFLGVNGETHEEYFLFLCGKSYQAAYSYLDRYWTPKEKGRLKNLFGKELEEVRKEILQIPYPSILNFGRKYIQKREADYTDDDWYDEVKKCAGDSKEWKAALGWIDVNLAVSRLHQTVVLRKQECGSCDECFDKLTSLDMYAVERYAYMPQLCADLAEIIQAWMLDETVQDTQLIQYLEKLGDKNVFSYEKYDWYTSEYRTLSKLGGLDWKSLQKRLEAVQKPKDAVYLFFHTPFWLKKDFYDFLKQIYIWIEKENLSESLQSLFADYRVAGKVICKERRTSGKGMLQLIPSYLFWSKRSNKAQPGREAGNYLTKKFERTIFVDENLLTHGTEKELKLNEFFPKLFFDYQGRQVVIPRNCKFSVLGLQDEKLLATELEKVEDEQIETEDITNILENFLDNLDLWMNDISLHKKAIDWGEWKGHNEAGDIVDDPVKVKFAFSMEKRYEIAERITNLLINLAEQDETQANLFMRKCSFPPLENVNEFRYIAAKHWDDFSVDETQRKHLQRIAEERLIKNDRISAECRVEIYMNTCLRNVVPLEHLLSDKELKNAFFSKSPEWIVPVVYERFDKRNHTTLFSMRALQEDRLPAVVSDCRFIYPHIYYLKDRNKNVIYGTIRSLMNEKEFQLGNLYVDSKELKKHFPWTEYIRCYYDLKNKLNDRVKLSIYERLSNIRIESFSDKNTIQNIDELHSVIHYQKYDVSSVYSVLMLLGKKNVCYDPSGTYDGTLACGFRMTEAVCEKWQTNMDSAYERLLNNEREKEKEKRDSVEWIGTVYYLSFLRVWVPKSKFVADLAEALEMDADGVRVELETCRAGLNQEVEAWQTIYAEEEKRKKERENKK